VTLLLNRQLVSRAKLYLVSAFPDTVKDCPKMRNLPKIFLRSFENVGPADQTIFGTRAIPYVTSYTILLLGYTLQLSDVQCQ